MNLVRILQVVKVRMSVADDCASPQVVGCKLRCGVANLVTAGVVTLKLNGQSVTHNVMSLARHLFSQQKF